MNKLLAFWQLFKMGYSISDPALWKKRQITVTAIAAVIMGVINLANLFGYIIPIDIETANMLAGGVLGAVNTILTIITTDKIGVKDKDEPKETNPFPNIIDIDRNP